MDGTFSYGGALYKNGKWGLCNTDGKEIVPCEFDWIGTYGGGQNHAIDGGIYLYKGGLKEEYNAYYPDGTCRWFFADNGTNSVDIYLGYDSISTLSNGYFKVDRNNKYGIINREGKTIVPMEWEYVTAENNAVCEKRENY